MDVDALLDEDERFLAALYLAVTQLLERAGLDDDRLAREFLAWAASKGIRLDKLTEDEGDEDE